MKLPEDVRNLMNASDNAIEWSAHLKAQGQEQSVKVEQLLALSKQVCQRTDKHHTGPAQRRENSVLLDELR